MGIQLTAFAKPLHKSSSASPPTSTEIPFKGINPAKSEKKQHIFYYLMGKNSHKIPLYAKNIFTFAEKNVLLSKLIIYENYFNEFLK